MPHPPEEEVSKLFVGECRPEQKPGQWAVMPPLVLEGLEEGGGGSGWHWGGACGSRPGLLPTCTNCRM